MTLPDAIDDRRNAATAGVLILAVLVSAVTIPAVVAGKPAYQVSVVHLPGDGDTLKRPNGDAWAEVDATEVPLTSAPSGLPNAQDTSTNVVHVEAATTADQLYVRLHWTDPTKNASPDSLTDFTDAVAMEVPVQPGTQPAIAMGSRQRPVNIWYWSAVSGGQSIVAGGGGTTTVIETAIETRAVYENGSWTVVMHRSLQSDLRNHRSFELDRDVPVAFAVWNGANWERAGRKAVSAWHSFPFGADARGPVLQYVLWAVVGIGIVAALLVTVSALRRGNA